MRKNVVNPLIEPPGALYFNLLFWKKLFNKNAINFYFSFFVGLIRPQRGAQIERGAQLKDLRYMSLGMPSFLHFPNR
jgi:hypothetical protein